MSLELPTEFNLEPHPRILPMLGEINLSQPRCVAELVDNAVDAFLSSKRSGARVDGPEVSVNLPTFDSPSAKLIVLDNGPGMDLLTLEKAVKAGWTGNDPISSLGMFGMGFNIATARLGVVTRVWTTREGDAEWYGLEINFEKLVRQGHFRTNPLTRPKQDRFQHGTEVSIETLKPEHRQWFAKAGNRSKLAQEFSRAYAAMLRSNGVPISFRLKVNGNLVQGHNHCVWGGEGNPNREVPTSRYGVINAHQPVDVRLPERPFCVACWQWLPVGEAKCSACQSEKDVVVRSRRVYGWLGIQRYLSAADYGIDFIRNGRKIEIANKDLFYWSDGQTQDEEYPIDDPRHRGRIIGEIHLDHCRVTYTKDRFDRNDPAWEDMISIVRGQGPLRPDKAGQLGYGQNTSPLFLLFQAFRRSSPKPKVAGAYARLLVVPNNDRAEEMARSFYAGEPEYQPDTKWMELVEEADRELLTPAQETPKGTGLDGWPSAAPVTASAASADIPPIPAPVRISLPSLSQEYRDDLTNLRWDIRAFSVRSDDPELGGPEVPWRLKAMSSGSIDFFVNPESEVFRSATMTPIDGLLAELSSAAMDFQRGGQSQIPFAKVLKSLRDRYATQSKLDEVELAAGARSVLSSVAKALSKLQSDDCRALFNELGPSEQESILGKMARKSVQNPQELISAGRFLEYATGKTLLKFFEAHPELFFDGKYWDVQYASLDFGMPSATDEARTQLLRYYASLLADAVWLADQDATDLEETSRPRLLRAALAVELLEPGSEQEGQ